MNAARKFAGSPWETKDTRSKVRAVSKGSRHAVRTAMQDNVCRCGASSPKKRGKSRNNGSDSLLGVKRQNGVKAELTAQAAAVPEIAHES